MLAPILLALAMTTIPAGVVTHHSGHSTLFRPNDQLVSTATSGQLIHFGDAIETSENGYIELFMSPGITLRATASSELSISKDFILLSGGRVWLRVQKAADQEPVQLRVWGGEISVVPGSTVMTEYVKDRGLYLTVIRGSARVMDKRQRNTSINVTAGYLYSIRPSESTLGIRPSSLAIWSLFDSEARKNHQDRIGIEKYLLKWVSSMQPMFERPLGAEQMPKANSLLRGEAGQLFDSLLEGSVRPPPFYENEVPPKGPNIRVEVNFEGD
ncbi:MAG: hypothetical protein VYC39_06550 [Myxococcota bacterium]|nr:hypothetical protein [Myxococcota bacterium]